MRKIHVWSTAKPLCNKTAAVSQQPLLSSKHLKVTHSSEEWLLNEFTSRKFILHITVRTPSLKRSLVLSVLLNSFSSSLLSIPTLFTYIFSTLWCFSHIPMLDGRRDGKMDGRMEGWTGGWTRRSKRQWIQLADLQLHTGFGSSCCGAPPQLPTKTSIKKEKDENSQHHKLVFKSNLTVFRKIHPSFLPNRIRLHLMKESA